MENDTDANEEEKSGDESSEPLTEAEEEDEVLIQNRRTARRAKPHTTLTFKDVEDALETFSGEGTQNFQRWLTNFEETAMLCEWTDMQKVIYAKKLLRGSAKLFVKFESTSSSWKKLKKSLSDEFSTTTNSKQVHRQLCLVKKKSDESYQEYIYRVLEIASHSEIELEAKILYIIDGVPGDEASKSILYGAETIKELRKKFIHFEAQQNKIRANADNSKQRQQGSQSKEKTVPRTSAASSSQSRRCYNCGDKKHLGADCPNKSKGVKCFACDEYGHVASSCPKPKKPQRKIDNNKGKSRCDQVSTGDKKLYKKIKLNDLEIDAIIDSGSDLHLARSSFYVKIKAPPLLSNSIPFSAVGLNEGCTFGSFQAEVCIDGIILNLEIHIVPDEFLDHDLLIGGKL